MTGGNVSCTEGLRSFLRNHCDGSSSSADYVEVFIDFENAVPTEPERALFVESEEVLSLAHRILSDLAAYGDGAAPQIRTNAQNPTNTEAHAAALEVLKGYASRASSYMEVARRIEQIVPQILAELCSQSGETPEDRLDDRKALIAQFARLIDFVMRFDACKMHTPNLQNDFAVYRRSLGRAPGNTEAADQANEVSLFLAAHSPMLIALAAAISNFINIHSGPTNIAETLVHVVKLCLFMLSNEEAVSRLAASSKAFCLRLMVGCVLLFDHVDSVGAYTKESPVPLKEVVSVLRQNGESDKGGALIAALHYTSRHLRDPSTPKSIRDLFE